MIRDRTRKPILAKILLNVLAAAMLLFLTTPASILNVVTKSAGLKSFLALEWVDTSTDLSKYIVQQLIPTLLVLGINELLIMVINYTVDFEYKERFSSHQRSQMRKTFVYFLFNMLLIPGLAAGAFSNIYYFFLDGISNFKTFFVRLFSLETGNFFMVLVINNAGGGFFAGMNVLYILVENYLSPAISMEYKAIERENEKWMKNNDMLFPWGVNYSLNLVIMGIGIVFKYLFIT